MLTDNPQVQRNYGSLTRHVLKDFEQIVGAHAVVTAAAKREQHGRVSQI